MRGLSRWRALCTCAASMMLLRAACTSGFVTPATARARLLVRHSPRLLASTTAKATTSSGASPPSILDEDGGMAKQYDFKAVEGALYSWWEGSGYFKPAAYKEGEKPYVVPMPPPNVTGYLHMGHAMFVALQDIMTRFNRMRGKPTLWLPGTDHAGIATQMLVERQLVSEGLDRKELGRERFLERVWDWKREKGGYITKQMRRLGASADWSRERFTLEPEMSEAVTEAFVRLHEKGLVYKGDYMVNWSPSLQTAVSDLEVEYSEEEGTLYYFKYMLEEAVGGVDHLPVATTRPETILGDTAVCVHPEDPRYSALVGKRVVVPGSGGRTIPVIADDYVDREFGTGALKITPGHDPNDYEIGKRHQLHTINIMNKDATINANGGSAYQGLDRFDCRVKLWADMKEDGLVLREEAHTQRVPRSQRGGEVIEPLVSTQWFVRTEGMAKASLDAVHNGKITIIPDRFEKTWNHWLENLHDWCISRQLWWGHRIPVWYAEGHDGYFVARSEAEARQLALDSGVSSQTPLTQDEDVLDTWFSSGLWPFSTVGWPQLESNGDAQSELARFYPAAVLETGYDIIFFWVARMVMLGIELTGQSPFSVIYLHGLVRDAEGQKMSKTKGNVIDPLETADIYGADALRYTLVTGVTPGQDIPLNMERVEASRNFANKLWNAGRFLIGNLNGLSAAELQSLAVDGPMDADELAGLALPERHIVSKCHALVGAVTDGLEKYSLGDAGRQIYEFLWDEYADWYIEASKTRMADPASMEAQRARRVLVYVFDTCLRLLHPYMPFITEALWQQLPHHGDSLMTASWPQLADSSALPIDQTAVARFESLQAVVRSIRGARAEYKVEPGRKIPAHVQVGDAALRDDLIAQKQVLALLARLDVDATVVSDMQGAPGERAVHCVVQDALEAYLPLAGMVDFAKEKKRLEKQAEKMRKDMAGLESRLNSPGFTDKAPAHVVEEARSQLAEQQDRLATILASIDDLQ